MHVFHERNGSLRKALGRSPAFKRGDLSTASEEVDIPALCQQSLERLSEQLGTRLSLTIAAELVRIPTDEYVLRQAFDALFRGLYSGFGTTAFELSEKRTAVTERDEEVVLLLALRGPVPQGFSRARDLVCINVAMKDASLRPLFDGGYSGDLTRADFLIGVVLGERLSFHPQPPTVETTFQTRHKRPTR